MGIVVVAPDMPIGPIPLDRALDIALGPATLREVHGPTLRMPNHRFDPTTCTRTFDFELGIPTFLRPVLAGKRVARVTASQTLIKSPSLWVVHGELHFPGSVLVDIRPTFVLREDHGGATTLSARVDHHVRLPPPLRGIAETFLKSRSEAEFGRLAAVLASRVG